jgi:hypothetical protein
MITNLRGVSAPAPWLFEGSRTGLAEAHHLKSGLPSHLAQLCTVAATHRLCERQRRPQHRGAFARRMVGQGRGQVGSEVAIGGVRLPANGARGRRGVTALESDHETSNRGEPGQGDGAPKPRNSTRRMRSTTATAHDCVSRSPPQRFDRMSSERSGRRSTVPDEGERRRPSDAGTTPRPQHAGAGLTETVPHPVMNSATPPRARGSSTRRSQGRTRSDDPRARSRELGGHPRASTPVPRPWACWLIR